MTRPPMSVDFFSRALLCCAAALAGAPPVVAQDRAAEAAGGRAASASVSMRFFNAPWADVLDRVAAESGSTLVMKDVPPGRFSRFDRARYTRREAVRMLNRELEPEGFRVFEQGGSLIVIHGRSVRNSYRRPVAPDAAGRRLSAADHGAARVGPVTGERKFGSLLPKADPAVRPAGRDATERSLVTTADLTGGGPSPVFPAADETASDAGAGPSDAERLAAADAAPAKTVTVRTARGNAKSVARRLLDAIKPHARLVDRGPGGLPAFEAHRPPAGAAEQTFDGAPAFAVGVDEARDELVVVAPGERADRVAAALRRLDAGVGKGKTQRVVAGTPATARVGRQVAPVLARLAAVRRQDGRPQLPQGGDAPGQGNPGGQGQGGGAVAPQSPADLPGIIQNLRSDVRVEEFGDTGVLILSGNEDDLAAVQQVIERLEALSAGLQPQIQLLLLQNVDSVPAAALLTEVFSELERVRNRGEQTPSRVTVLPVGRPNAVIVIASETDLEAVEALTEKIDRPVPAGAQVEVFKLENSIASQVADALNNFNAADGGVAAGDGEGAPFPLLEAFADVRTNSVIVRAAPNGLKLAAKLVADLDSGTSELVTRVEIVDLDFAIAEELAEVINQTIQGVVDPSQRPGGQIGGGFGGGGAERDALQIARSVIVEYVTATGQRERSGLLADAAVAAEPGGNRLILTATEKTMPLLIALVAALDSPSGARADVKAFTLQSADAETAVEILNELFAVDGDNPTNVTLEGTADAGSNLAPLRFAADPRTRTVLAIGGADALAIVEAILLRLDDENRNRQEFFSVKLVNAPAELVATSLAQLIDGRRTLLGEVPGILSPVELIERNVVVIPEPFTNRLLIFASDGRRDEILRLIRQIDEAPPQVAIQALLVEVTLDNTDEFGVELGVQDSTLFGRANTGADANPFAFNNTNLLGQAAVNPSALATQALSNLGLGRGNADLGIGGFVLSASSENVSILLRALQAKRQVQVLSRPQVTVVDQQTAEINVGQTVPVLAGVTIGLGQTTPQIDRIPSGLTLRVTPRISPDGTVFMQVGAENNNFILTGVPVFTDAQTGTVFNAPIENVSRTETSVSVPNGQTVVLGGIITDSESVNERKVPYLGDIPYLGQLFRTDTTVKVRNELLVFLTPRIIYTDADFELIKQVEADRMHYLEHEAEAIHGPLFGVPPEPGTGGYLPGGPAGPRGFGPAELGPFAPGHPPAGAFDDAAYPPPARGGPVDPFAGPR